MKLMSKVSEIKQIDFFPRLGCIGFTRLSNKQGIIVNQYRMSISDMYKLIDKLGNVFYTDYGYIYET